MTTTTNTEAEAELCMMDAVDYEYNGSPISPLLSLSRPKRSRDHWSQCIRGWWRLKTLWYVIGGGGFPSSLSSLLSPLVSPPLSSFSFSSLLLSPSSCSLALLRFAICKRVRTHTHTHTHTDSPKGEERVSTPNLSSFVPAWEVETVYYSSSVSSSYQLEPFTAKVLQLRRTSSQNWK